MNIFGQTPAYWTNRTSGKEQGVPTPIPQGELKQLSIDELLDQLNLKQQLQGRIVSKEGNQVLMQLDNHTQFRARLQGNLNLHVGQEILFAIKEKQGDLLVLTPVEEDTDTQLMHMARELVSSKGFSETPKNIALAQELIKASLPVTKENMQKMVAASLQFQDVEPEVFAHLEQWNMPIEEGTIRQYQLYQQAGNQFVETLKDTKQALGQMITEVIHTLPPEEGLAMVEQWTTHLLSADTQQAKGDFMQQSVVVNEEVGTNLTWKSMDQATLSQYDIEKLLQIDQTSGEIKRYSLTEEQINYLVDSLKTTAPDVEGYVRILSQLKDSGNITAALRIMKETPFCQALENTLQERFSINPEHMEEPREIEELFGRIAKDIELAQKTFQYKGTQQESFMQQSGHLSESLSFMHQLNHEFIYVQLPILQREAMGKGELYVYGKRRQQQKDGPVKVALRLSMAHLGLVEVDLTLKNNQIHAAFSLGEDKAVEIVATNMEDLARKIKAQGFGFTSQVTKKEKLEEQINPITCIEQEIKVAPTRYTFDIKA